ncbi:MAG: stage V sporulation protein B [Alicyclobacillus herbarius]|uniref:stage V sporulation protein B n=1 Tax=Alicyclobacillus herbarius TaxID=122960 RepID=UPI000419D2BF|nr:stage V sporulation protein B [Alicyclobacillus herbarius]MCL6632325.1 stage V sporulation protein B [Alicyclobacillus herbarius]
MVRRSFLHGAMILIAAQLVNRILGFVYRIFLTRLIGAQGIGLFQLVSPLLSLILTFVTAGLPVAISKLVAETVVQRDKVRTLRVLRVSTAVILMMAVVFTLLMWFLRGLVRRYWLTDPMAYPTYLAMIPIVSIIAIASIFRGYFQGLQDMSPPAWASIVETIVRILSVWVLAAYFVHVSLAYAAAAAMLGMMCGELAGLIFLAIQYRRRARVSVLFADAPNRSLETTKQTLYAIAEVAAPVTLNRLIGSLLYAAEPVLVTRALVLAGFSAQTATMLYGQYGGMAIPLLVFPTVFTGALATTLVPAVSEAAADGQHGRIRIRLMQTWKATALVGFPMSVILTLFATPLCQAIYGEPGVGPILALMAPSGFLLYLRGPLASILQGLNHAGAAMRNSVIGGVVQLILMYLLAARPGLGILGVALATSASVVLTTTLNFISVYQQIGFAIRIDDTAKIALASFGMLIVLELLRQSEAPNNTGSILLAIAIGGLVYTWLLGSMRVLTTVNLSRIPRIGPTLARILKCFPFTV